jgi:hypothetical protein
MAKKGKVVATLKKKRAKNKPFAYVDKQGNVRHATRAQFRKKRNKKNHTILQRKVVSQALLKKRKAKGKKGIILFVRGKKVFSTPRKLKGRKKRKRRKLKRRRKAKTRARRRRTRRKKSRRCPKTRRGGGFRSAAACVSRGKGKTLASKKVFNKAVRRLRRSKKGRSFLRKKKIKMARHKGKVA